jgi:DNA-binding PadR family transcriptional regulator
MKLLTRKEELIMLAVFRLQEDACLVSIRKFLIDETRRRWSPGNVYVPLDSLYKRNYLDYVLGDPTPRRGGKAKKYYRLTRIGFEALAELKALHDSFWRDIPEAVKD